MSNFLGHPVLCLYCIYNLFVLILYHSHLFYTDAIAYQLLLQEHIECGVELLFLSIYDIYIALIAFCLLYLIFEYITSSECI